MDFIEHVLDLYEIILHRELISLRLSINNN